MNQELATITPYTPPYWDERVWNHAGRKRWETEWLDALKLQDADKLETLLDEREYNRRGLPTRWHKPYGKTRAFALDYTADILAGKRFIRLALTPQKLFQQWRAERARIVEDEDVEWSNHNIRLAEWEDGLAEEFQAAVS